MITLEPSEDKAEPGNLHTVLVGDKLMVPREVLEALDSLNLRSGLELYSHLVVFPSNCARLLKWSEDECLNAWYGVKHVLGKSIIRDSGYSTVNDTGAKDPSLLL